MFLSVLKGASIVGATAIGTSALLQKGYQVTGYTPPNFVYIFFTAFLAYGLIEITEHVMGKELLETGHELPAS